MLKAAIKIKVPSMPLEKYSALSCPKACSSSAGCAAIFKVKSATIAAARFISDSSASDNKPTEPVNQYAAALSAIVTIAAAIESHAKRVRFSLSTEKDFPTVRQQ